MPAQNSKPTGAVSAIAGFLGLSVLAGVLVTAMVTPALAVTGMTAKSSIGIFENLPEYITLDAQTQKNTIFGVGDEGAPVEIAEVFHQNREVVKWDEVNQFVKDAAIAAEDRHFYEHGGINISSTLRAALSNVISSEIQSGASTISMQLVKNILIMRSFDEETEAKQKIAREEAQAQTIDRKLKEMKMAIGLEKRYTKNEILLGYLNIAGFGSNTYGIESAAQEFYSTTAKDLTLAQAASLVAIVQTPSKHSLNNPENFEANTVRRNLILNNMLELGSITQAQHDEAKATPLEVLPQAPRSGCIWATVGNFYCDYIQNLVPELEGLGATKEERLTNWKRGGYEVYTALDVGQQKNADAIVRAEAPATEARFQLGAAASVVQPGTGRILAMSQNKVFNNAGDDGDPATTAVNFNTDYPYGGSSGFQVGSTYKIFTLAEWLKQGHGLNEVVDARVKTYDQSKFKAPCDPSAGQWKARNYGGAGGSSATSVMRATSGSINTAFVAMAFKLDLCDIRDTATAMGVHRADGNTLDAKPSSILGTNEIAPVSLAAAFATVANAGTYCKPIAVDRIVNAEGEELPGQKPDCHPAVSPEVAAAMAHAMRGVMNWGGTGQAANPGGPVPVIGKTGTSDGAWHTWMAGASTSAALAVWVGNIVGQQNLEKIRLPGGYGNQARHHIFKSIMGALNGEFGGAAFPAPPTNLLVGQTARVPDVSGQTSEQATALLESLGFTAQAGAAVDSAMPAGKIVHTSPGAGSKVSLGSVVTFHPSTGAINKVMPDVVGDGQDKAVSEITDAGITGAISYNYVLAENPGDLCKVAASNPAAGAGMASTSAVTLDVYSTEAGTAPPGDCS